VTLSHKTVGQMRTDEPGATRDKDIHFDSEVEVGVLGG
jgi:hypothetical protein